MPTDLSFAIMVVDFPLSDSILLVDTMLLFCYVMFVVVFISVGIDVARSSDMLR